MILPRHKVRREPWEVRLAYEYSDAFCRDMEKMDRLVRWIEDRECDPCPAWLTNAYEMALDEQEWFQHIHRRIEEIIDDEYARERRRACGL